MEYKSRYKNVDKQFSYENACDQFYWGMGRSDWCCSPKLTAEERDEVWRLAFWDMAEPDIEHGEMVRDVYRFAPEYQAKGLKKYRVCFVATGGLDIYAASEDVARARFYREYIQDALDELGENGIDITEVFEVEDDE